MSMEATKRCPYCAEEVLVAARKCKHCGSDLKAEVEESKKTLKTLGIILGGTVLVIWLVNTCSSTNPASADSGYSPPSSSERLPSESESLVTSAVEAGPPPAVEPPIMRITAQELKDRYDANEVAANQQFDGKRLEITGTIKSIDEDFIHHPTIKLATDNEFESVQIELPVDQKTVAAQLTRGHAFTARCDKIKRIITSPIAEDCMIVSSSSRPKASRNVDSSQDDQVTQPAQPMPLSDPSPGAEPPR